MRIHLVLGTVAGLVASSTLAAHAADYDGPFRSHRVVRGALIGDCVHTRIESIGPLPGGAPVIRYTDGVMQEYESDMLGQVETRPGDPIRLCLVAFTRDCGAVFEDEQPGRTYATGNLRTGAAWTSPDIRSSCATR